MTFLEFVITKLLGTPTLVTGRPYWCCPFHADSTPSMTTVPPDQGKKDRWRCFGCTEWGDEHDILKEFVRDYGERVEWLKVVREEYNAVHNTITNGVRPAKADRGELTRLVEQTVFTDRVNRFIEGVKRTYAEFVKEASWWRAQGKEYLSQSLAFDWDLAGADAFAYLVLARRYVAEAIFLEMEDRYNRTKRTVYISGKPVEIHIALADC